MLPPCRSAMVETTARPKPAPPVLPSAGETVEDLLALLQRNPQAADSLVDPGRLVGRESWRRRRGRAGRPPRTGWRQSWPGPQVSPASPLHAREELASSRPPPASRRGRRRPERGARRTATVDEGQQRLTFVGDLAGEVLRRRRPGDCCGRARRCADRCCSAPQPSAPREPNRGTAGPAMVPGHARPCRVPRRAPRRARPRRVYGSAGEHGAEPSQPLPSQPLPSQSETGRRSPRALCTPSSSLHHVNAVQRGGRGARDRRRGPARCGSPG